MMKVVDAVSSCGRGIHSVRPSLHFRVTETARSSVERPLGKRLVDGLLANSNCKGSCRFAQLAQAYGTAGVRMRYGPNSPLVAGVTPGWQGKGKRRSYPHPAAS